RNHIQNMKIQLYEKNYNALDCYLNELVEDLNTVDTVIKTGNVMVDAILNSKLSLSAKLNVKINVKANVPQKLKISDVELCSILGNLLDNANEACEKVPKENRFIRVYIGTLKGQFYLSVQNCAASKEIIKKEGKYLSQKSGDHGFGLFRIDSIATKYRGFVNRQDEEGVFATEIMLPL
ncbi:MAG: sensor histidine kinase, partial [Clostridiales bacterium]|nr:sensor histidine kinase [Clostridiales bacterium]